MTILQDILGLITKRKIKTPSDNDYIVSAAYTDTQERLKPQPKMVANLLNIGALKSYILANVPISIAPYKVYSAILNQSGTNAPVATVLENTIGNIVWSYSSVGNYDATLTGAFTNNKVLTFISNSRVNSICTLTRFSDNVLKSAIVITDSVPFQPSNSLLKASIEIRVYN